MPLRRELPCALDPTIPVAQEQTIADVLERSKTSRWLNMSRLAFFASVALMLTMVGTYSVLAD